MAERKGHCNTTGQGLAAQEYLIETEKAGSFIVSVRAPRKESNTVPDPNVPCLIFQSIAQLARSKKDSLPLISGTCRRCACYMHLIVRKNI